jgi:chitinase
VSTAGTWNLYIEQGADWELPVTYGLQTDPDDPLTFAPVDLTGWTARMEIRQKAGGTVYATLTSATGEITLDGANEPNIVLALDSVITLAMPKGSAAYDLDLDDGSGRQLRLLEGAVTISPAVTQPAVP